MTRSIQYISAVILFLTWINEAKSQTDSSKFERVEVRNEITDMRDKINVFLSEQVTNDPLTNLNRELSLKLNTYIDSMNNRLNRQQLEIEDLRKQIKTINDKKIVEPEVVTEKYDNIIAVLYFDIGSYTLSEENKITIRKIVNENNDKTIQLVAYTDWVGNNEFNQQLSNKRATVVQNELTANGFQIPNIKIYSRGKMAEENEKLPAKECRRVEIRHQ